MRHELGPKAERIIQECERLNSMFALSLRPHAAQTGDQAALLDMINAALWRREEGCPRPQSGGELN